MNLIASMITKDEHERYLRPCIEHLLTFVDQVRVLDDGSSDETVACLESFTPDLVSVFPMPDSRFYEHEGRRRTELLDWTLAGEPTHVLNLDADELVSDGPALRALVEADPDAPVWHLPIREVWEADEEELRVRVDGGWNAGRTLCWRVPQLGRLSFPNKALACGRVPMQIRSFTAKPSGVDLLHLGWLDESERVARHARYVRHDRGRFHRLTHLNSILWPPEKIALETRAWPDGLLPWKNEILVHAGVAA